MFRPNHPLHLVLGPTLWAVWFVVIYAGLSVACRLSPPAADQGAMTWISGLLLLMTVLVILLLLILGRWCWREASTNPSLSRNRRFISRVSAGAYLVMAISSFLIGVPIILLPPCL